MQQKIHTHKTFENIIYAEKVVRDREFEKCLFRGCDFSNSNFSDNRFSDCQFIGCNLGLMKLRHTTFDNIKFKDCKLIGLNFSECADLLFTVHFDNCLMDFTTFANKKMGKTSFINSSLKNAEFTNTYLSKALFDNTDLQSAVFDNTNLQEANLATAYNYTIDPERNNIKKAKFSIHGIMGLLAKYDIRLE